MIGSLSQYDSIIGLLIKLNTDNNYYSRSYIPIILIPYSWIPSNSYHIRPLLLRCNIIIILIRLSSIHQRHKQIFITCCIAIYCNVVIEPGRLVIYSLCYNKPVVIEITTALDFLIYIYWTVNFQFILWIESFDSVIWWSVWHSYNSNNYTASSCSKTRIVKWLSANINNLNLLLISSSWLSTLLIISWIYPLFITIPRSWI